MILPVAVLRKRLAAPLLVFIFGILKSPSDTDYPALSGFPMTATLINFYRRDLVIFIGNRLSYLNIGPESTLR